MLGTCEVSSVIGRLGETEVVAQPALYPKDKGALMISRRSLVALFTAILVASSVFASAASLGGIDNASLGADDEVVTACNTDGIDVAFTSSYDATEGGYAVTAVELSSVDANCDGLNVEVTVADDSQVSLGSGTATADDSGEVTVTLADAVNAADIEHVAVIISD